MRLKGLRQNRNLTQREVAEAIYCSPVVYSRYERGEREPDIETLCRLAEYFCVTVDALIGRTPLNQP